MFWQIVLLFLILFGSCALFSLGLIYLLKYRWIFLPKNKRLKKKNLLRQERELVKFRNNAHKEMSDNLEKFKKFLYEKNFNAVVNSLEEEEKIRTKIKEKENQLKRKHKLEKIELEIKLKK